MAGTITQALRDCAIDFDDETLPEAGLLRGAYVPRAPARAAVVSADQGFFREVCAHFEIQDLIGQGGMGLVYRAWDRALCRKVAIKILPDESAPSSDDRERLLDEARAQARLSSPNVVHVYYVGRVQHPDHQLSDCAFFAMELCEGGTLDDVLARGGRLEAARARELLAGVACGLRDALAAGLVHRDIKPSNLLLDESGRVRIADFGLARRLGERGRVGSTYRGRFVGTPLYMAPERARGDAYDHRADMYSLGCTFYHLLSGRPPYDGRNVVQILHGHLAQKARPLAEVAPGVPRALARIVERLMEKEPARRFASYDELLEALDDAARPSRTPPRSASLAFGLVVAALLTVSFGWLGLVSCFCAAAATSFRLWPDLRNWRKKRTWAQRPRVARAV